MIFLDVDCIPDVRLVGTYANLLRDFDGLLMGDIFYLPQAFDKAAWDFPTLYRMAVPHPRRPVLSGEAQLISRYELFWTLNFALQRRTLSLLEGFDAGYQGYGAEDTDFAFTARQQGIPFALCPARAYHQPHPVYNPPLQHFGDIISNATRFKAKWDVWPMEGWLQQFARAGLISWQPSAQKIQVIRPPDRLEINAAHQDAPAGF